MIELRKEDMLNINGGANAILITTIIGTIITFIVGTLKGYSNPGKCNVLADKVRSGFRLLKKKCMITKRIPLQNIR